MSSDNSIIWKEFPEINRRVAFTCNVGVMPSESNVSVGCHCGSIGTVSLHFGSRYYAALMGKHVEVLDTTKEKPFQYRMDRYGYFQHSKQEEEEHKVHRYLREKGIGIKDFGDEYYGKLVRRCSTLPFWVLSDVVNSKSVVRKDHTPNDSYPKIVIYGSTYEFAKYLINNKVGFIIESPIVQNPNHRNKEKYSLNQIWLWTHPDHISRSLPVAKMYPGKDKFPTKEEWIHTVGTDLGIDDPETVVKAVFNDGRFPERTKHSLRGSNGRFVKEA